MGAIEAGNHKGGNNGGIYTIDEDETLGKKWIVLPAVNFWEADVLWQVIFFNTGGGNGVFTSVIHGLCD